jgi:acid phosphatase family membrane protein YuiD
MRELWDGLWQNQVLICALTVFIVAQLSKVFINLIITKKWSWERLIGPGGMPSSHAATVCALVVASMLTYGTASFAFAVSVVLAIIVINDAWNVRLETGRQAAVLNHLLNRILERERHPGQDVPLKELMGHTPLQVTVGSLLGIVIALMMC